MKAIALTAVLALVAPLALAPLLAQESVQETVPEAPPKEAPSPEHEWLLRLAGDWSAEVGSGVVTETIRPLGQYWILSESQYPPSHGSIRTVMTLGYDLKEQAFVGTWVDSGSSYLWTYRGALDEERKTLTLEAEGPGPGGKHLRWRDVIELDGPDRKVHRNYFLDADQEWVQMGEAVSVRTE